jgi:uncharacterized protein YlxW (UPF0749 family)
LYNSEQMQEQDLLIRYAVLYTTFVAVFALIWTTQSRLKSKWYNFYTKPLIDISDQVKETNNKLRELERRISRIENNIHSGSPSAAHNTFIPVPSNAPIPLPVLTT